jgi:hypothetical protein
MKKQELTPIEYVWYILINIFTFGSFYFIKILIKKAIVDAHNSQLNK